MSIKGKLLLIDDNIELLEYLSNFFSMYSYEVIKAENGEKGLKRFKQYQPEVVITDIRLPDIMGNVLVKKIRDINDKVPIVVITAYSDKELILDALKNGAVEILKKPFRRKELKYLINKIETLFRQRKVEISSKFISWEKRVLKVKNDIYIIPSVINFIFSNIDYVCEDDSLLRLGLQEIIINSIEHGNLNITSEEKSKLLEDGDYTKKLIKRAKLKAYYNRYTTIEVFSNPEYLKITVTDMGNGFETLDLPDVDNPENFLKESGKGILMAMNAFNSVKYNDIGNSVTIIKHSDFIKDKEPEYDNNDGFDIYKKFKKYVKLKEEFDFELDLAAEFQNTFLPKKEEINKFEGVNCDFLYEPLLKVSGDFLDIIKLEDGIYSYFISDISGHGVAAALISSMLKVFFSLYAKDILSPELLFEILNLEFFNYLNSGEYFTSFYGIYFKEENKFIYTNANHPAPLLLKNKQNEIIPLNTDGFFVGIFKDSVFEEKEVILEKGDRILFFTDGIIEAKNEYDEEFGLERVKQIYIDEKKTCLHDLIQIIKKSVYRFTGMKIEDDVTILGLEIE